MAYYLFSHLVDNEGAQCEWPAAENIIKDVTGNYTYSIVFICLPIVFRISHTTEIK
jgi:hypothetical protein